jgi:hypothetical protein
MTRAGLDNSGNPVEKPLRMQRRNFLPRRLFTRQPTVIKST